MKHASATVALLFLFAGCVDTPVEEPPADDGGSETGHLADTFADGALSIDGLVANVTKDGSKVDVTGFSHFGLYVPAFADIFPEQEFGDLQEKLETKLRSEIPTTYSIGFILDENLIAEFGQPARPAFDFVQEHGALLVVPGSPPSEGISYLRVEGEAFDLFAFLAEAHPSVRPMPLIIATSIRTLQPESYTMSELQQEFEAILGDGLVAHIRTSGVAFGTTIDNLEGSSSPVDMGLYEVFAPYFEQPSQLTTVRIGMGAIWLGKGQEFLGQDITIEGFLVSEAALQAAAKSRSLGLADEAADALPQVEQAGSLENPWTQNIDNLRIPGFLLAYHIAPSPYHDGPGLSDLYASKPGLAAGATAPVRVTPADGFGGNFDNRIVGTSLKAICLFVSLGSCETPYDLGVYVLVTFVWDGTSENFTAYAIPVLYPVRSAAPTDLAPTYTGQRVRVSAVYSKYDVAKSILSEKAHLAFESKAWGAAILAVLDEPERYSGFVDLKVLDGFLWANAIEVLPPTTPLAPVLFLPPRTSDVGKENVSLSWFWPHDEQTIPNYSVYASPYPYFVPSERFDGLADEKYTVEGRSAGKWYFKVRAYAASNFGPSNRVWATVTGREPSPPDPAPSSATNPLTVTASPSNSTPCRFSTVTINVSVKNDLGAAIPSADIGTTWHYQASTATRNGVTDANGEAEISGDTGAAAGYTVTVDVTATKNGATASSSTSFTTKQSCF